MNPLPSSHVAASEAAQERDRILTEVLMVADMLKRVHEPSVNDYEGTCIRGVDGRPITRNLRGSKVTLKKAREMVRHAEIRLNELAKTLT